MKYNWTIFTSWTNLVAAYRVDEVTGDYRIKLVSKVPKTHYYSCLNEIGQYFDEVVFPKLQPAK